MTQSLLATVNRLAFAVDAALADGLTQLQSIASRSPASTAVPPFEWTGLADAAGHFSVHTGSPSPDPAEVAAWVRQCHDGPWFGMRAAAQTGDLGDPGRAHSPGMLLLCTPLAAVNGVEARWAIGRLPAQWLDSLIEGAKPGASVDARAHVFVLDSTRHVLIDAPVGSPGSQALRHPQAAVPYWTPEALAIQRLDDDRRLVVVRARPREHPMLLRTGLDLMLVQPTAEVPFWRGGALQLQIAVLSLALSAVAALVGILFARRMTRRLTRLTEAVHQVGASGQGRIEVPAGEDEVTELGKAFAALLDTLRHEHAELNALSIELEHKVQARTREVERLASESRYAAVVRERLRLARDLHDTLAHSMMAMLAQVRTLRKLHSHDPAALALELENAERIAHEGLNEARDAIGQMRLNVVRDLGLGAALGSSVQRFAERTGVDTAYASDPQAASFSDERAEVVFRIAEEALRNIDSHASASRVEVRLRDIDDATLELEIRDDGIGFDPESLHPGHYGIVGIREQAQLIDAELDINSALGHGSRLCLRLRFGPDLHS